MKRFFSNHRFSNHRFTNDRFSNDRFSNDRSADQRTAKPRVHADRFLNLAMSTFLGATLTFTLALTSTLGTSLSAQDSLSKSELRKLGKAYETAPTAYREYKKDIIAFSKQAVESEDDSTRLNAVLDLCLLYYNIRTDVRYSKSETLRGYTNRIHYRLNETKKAIEKELKRNGQTAKQNEFLHNVSQVSAQPLNDDELMAATTGLSDQMTLMSQANGGPHHVVEYAGGYFGGIMESNANDLIELIEDMIHPDSWENAGGVGGMRYWSQSMVLVIRATTEVHEDIERFLNMLRYSR